MLFLAWIYGDTHKQHGTSIFFSFFLQKEMVRRIVRMSETRYEGLMQKRAVEHTYV